jgi:hypothetical protein
MPDPPWIATTATVTTCRFQFAGLSTLVIGYNTREKFRITFDYYAHGRLYSDEFQSPTAIPQNTTFPITYNPLDPAENSRTNHPTEAPANAPPTWLIGIAGSIVLSLLWLLILRSCH